MQVSWTRRALDNLDAAVEYIAADDPAAAQDVAQKIWDSTQLLASQPRMGRLGRVAGTRELVITGLPFVIPYIEKNGVIVILRLMHSSMKWPDLL